MQTEGPIRKAEGLAGQQMEAKKVGCNSWRRRSKSAKRGCKQWQLHEQPPRCRLRPESWRPSGRRLQQQEQLRQQVSELLLPQPSAAGPKLREQLRQQRQRKQLQQQQQQLVKQQQQGSLQQGE